MNYSLVQKKAVKWISGCKQLEKNLTTPTYPKSNRLYDILRYQIILQLIFLQNKKDILQIPRDVSVIYLFYIKPYISNSIPITVTHTANVIYPSFVISFQGLYLPSNRLPRISITLFLKNSTTSVIKSIIATTKAANITVTGISMSFTYDNNTFIVLNSYSYYRKEKPDKEYGSSRLRLYNADSHQQFYSQYSGKLGICSIIIISIKIRRF